MNSSVESPEVPKRRCWSIVRKAQIIGFLFGGFLTIGVHKLVLEFGVEGIIGQLLIIPWSLMFWPADLVSKIFGWTGFEYGDLYSMVPWKFVFFAALTNALLLTFAGTIIGWLIQKLKTKS